MRIALDMDGVIANFLKAMREVFPSIPKHPEKFNLEEYLNEEDKERFHIFVTNPDVFRHLEIIPGMEKLIPYFNEHDTYIVSSRWQKVRNASLEWIAEVGLKPKGIIFTSSKAKAIRENNLQVFIEDQPKYVEPVLQEDSAIILMPRLSYNEKFIDREQQLERHQTAVHQHNGWLFEYRNPEELEMLLKKMEGIVNGSKKR